VSENRVLRRIFGPKREEITGNWRKLHNEELHNVYSSENIIIIIKSRRTRRVGHVAHIRMIYTYKLLVRKPEGKRSV
jgi:hypothetical protein